MAKPKINPKVSRDAAWGATMSPRFNDFPTLSLEEGAFPVGETLPILAAQAIQIKGNAALAQSHFGNDPLRAGKSRLRGIEHSEIALLHTQDRDIRLGADVQIAEFRPLDLLRRR